MSRSKTAETSKTRQAQRRHGVDQADRGSLLALAASGIVLLVGAFAPQTTGPPVETATAAQIRTFLKDHTRLIEVQALFGVLLIPTIIVFTAALAALARRHQRELLANLIQAAGILAVIPPMLNTAFTSMTVVQAVEGTPLTNVDDAVIRSWYAMGNATHFLGDLWLVPLALLTMTGGLMLLQTRILPRWVGALGIVTAAAGSVGLGGYLFAIPRVLELWFAGLYGWIIWTLAIAATAAIALRRHHRGPAPIPR